MEFKSGDWGGAIKGGIYSSKQYDLDHPIGRSDELRSSIGRHKIFTYVAVWFYTGVAPLYHH